MTYLSIAPEGLREAFITGGLSPIGRPVDDIYGHVPPARGANRRYFERYPDDRARVRDILRRLDDEDVRLPSGDRLTSRRFRQLGLWLGDSAGFEHLHHVIELPFGSLLFLHVAESGLHFSSYPIYATLHESSYADGVATRWSASRLLPDEVEQEGWFTAEHVFPWMWEDFAAWSRNVPPRRSSRSTLASALRRGAAGPQRGAVAATIYVNDLYVERDFAEETAAAIRGSAPGRPTSSSTTGSARTGSESSAA